MDQRPCSGTERACEDGAVAHVEDDLSQPVLADWARPAGEENYREDGRLKKRFYESELARLQEALGSLQEEKDALSVSLNEARAKQQSLESELENAKASSGSGGGGGSAAASGSSAVAERPRWRCRRQPSAYANRPDMRPTTRAASSPASKL